MCLSWSRLLLSSLIVLPDVSGFLSLESHFTRPPAFLWASRYGPPPPGKNNLEEKDNNNERKQKFRTLLEESLATTKADHLPRLLANNIELIMSLQYGGEGAQVISELIEEAKAEGQEQFQRTVEVAETIVTFAEDFVEQASQMDDQNKLLLGKIIKTMTFKDYGDDAPRDREEVLDQLMEEEKENFTPGFLRHIEGECERIANAPKMTPESARLMEILRIIQTRVLEELGQDMGEAALVLGQLMGYENKDELLGVLDAGLTVRGKDFAFEMAALTEEALGGFQRVPGGVDPELVERVTFIDRRLREFLEETNEFQ